MSTTLTDVLNLLELVPLGAHDFEGAQLDSPNHHIVGGQLAAQALMAASHTALQRPPHSLHVYFLRRGDARRPVRFEVFRLHDGGVFSARRIAASQNGELLMEGLASFTDGIEAPDYQLVKPDAPEPELLTPIEEQLAPYADEFDGQWLDRRPFDTRYVNPPPRIAMDMEKPAGPVSRIWLRARGEVPANPIINCCLQTYLSSLTLLESALGPMHKSPVDVSALLDHTVWFHRPANFSDWLYFDQNSPSGIAGRALATGTMFNRTGSLVCTASQEGYFPRRKYQEPINGEER
jgi:acyl-CoA thioesterase-2